MILICYKHRYYHLYFGGIFKLFGQELLVMRIASTVLGAGIMLVSFKIFKELKLNIKWSILSSALLFLFIKDNFYIDYNYAILFIILVLIYVELKYKNYSTRYNLLIGLLAGLTILLKQSTGIIISVITVLYLLAEKRDKQTLKAVAYRVCGVLIPCIILLIYLLATNSMSSFIDYCVLGIGTFKNSISYLRLLRGGDLTAIWGMIAPLTLVVLLVINIINIKRKVIKTKESNLILFVYAVAEFTVVYPIADKVHFVIAAFPAILITLYYICKKIQEIKNIKVSIFIEHFMNIITISFVGILILQAINDIYLYTQIDKSILNHFSNIPISSTLQARIIEVDAYIKDEERDVYILDSEAAVYMIPLDKYNKDFDMFLKGNLGSASEEGQIEKIKNMKNAVILIKNDKMALNWQTPTKVIEYIKNNLEKIGTVSFFDVYITT
jgi:membrane protein